MEMVIAFIFGIVSWTFLEYILHRFLGHVHKGKNFFKSEHLRHHAKAHYFAPAYKKAFAAIIVGGLLLVIFLLFTDIEFATAYLTGFIGMYGLYEVTHLRYHKTEPIWMPFIVLRKHHFYHHFHNPYCNYGVTTRFWDRVFGTYVSVNKVTVPKKLAMQWLLAENEIKPHYSNHFRLS